MSSLAPGHILQGASWDYRILNPLNGDNTHTSTVLKAEIISRGTERVSSAPQWAVIKIAPPGDANAMENMNRERQTYRLPGVASSECFRRMYDVIDPSTIALEWMDTTLAEVKYKPDTRTYLLILSLLKAVLASCITLESYSYYKPANILLSGIETGRITAKVADLGLGEQAAIHGKHFINMPKVVPIGNLFNAQPYGMRAPEVFLGHACSAKSQVWAVAAMLLCWIKPGVLGVWDSPHPLLNEAWSMAKIKRLFPLWNLPGPDKVERHSLKAAVESAVCLSKEVPELQAISAFDDEFQKVEIPQQLKDILRFMLVADPSKRPSASSVLVSSELQALANLVNI
ncbi:uncharacterized protein DSM5745_03950 [Aspergillus mulundensis]|uniref:Protein kinase domain-containing protein n=1 Tax=Aspergillus mulundensis TaxID=1810919 RepID=A0A3D8SC09_9EURO|nr:Uncharacterized protein DSM5745_03950 [Aspergillus mulundensis]RDW83624.1 Uncharacterized protein DSM5745_03950 [Aspergillus mulundensis]